MNVADFTTGDSERAAEESLLVSTEKTDAVSAGLVGSADKSSQMIKDELFSRGTKFQPSGQKALRRGEKAANAPAGSLFKAGKRAGTQASSLASVKNARRPSDRAYASHEPAHTAAGTAEEADVAASVTKVQKVKKYGVKAAKAKAVSKVLEDTEFEGVDDAYYTAKAGKRLARKAKGKILSNQANQAKSGTEKGLGQLAEKKYRHKKSPAELQREIQSKRNQMIIQQTAGSKAAGAGVIGSSGAAASGAKAAAASGGGGAAAGAVGGCLMPVLLGFLAVFLALGILGGILGGDSKKDVGDLTGIEAEVASYLLEHGFTYEATAAIMGNIACEGSWDPASDHNFDGKFNHSYERACGLFQYTSTSPGSGEYWNFKYWCAATNRVWSTTEAQMTWTFSEEFGNWKKQWGTGLARRGYYSNCPGYAETNGSYYPTTGEFKEASDVAVAAYTWMACYERCANGKYAHLDRRIEKSKEYLAKLGSGGGKGTGEDYRTASAKQKKVADKALSGNLWGCRGGYCQRWVATCYQKALGGDYRSTCCAHGAWLAWGVSSSTKNIPVGAAVYGSGSGSGGKCHNPYGHVGIYVGDGKVASNIGGSKPEVISLNDWIKKYKWYGWGWNGGTALR